MMDIAERALQLKADFGGVYEAGYTKGQMNFQKMLSNDGARGNYRQVFEGANFRGYTFNPTIYPTALGSVFYNYFGEEFPKGINFSKAINAESVTDTAKIPYNTFAYCRNQERIPDMNIPVQYRYTNTYNNCYAKKIDIIRVAETTLFSSTFSGCTYLEDVTFEGVIGTNISFANSPLVVECIKHIIEHMKNYNGTDDEYTYTVTFKSSAFSALEAEGATAEYNGVACTWAELIDNKKWNLVKA